MKLNMMNYIKYIKRLAKFERGFSVIEVLIASSVEIIAISGMLLFFTSFQKQSIEINQKLMYQQEARLAMKLLARDLRETSIATVNSSANFVSFASLRDSAQNFSLNAEGQALWKKSIFYYIPSGTTILCRHESPKLDWTNKSTSSDIPNTPPWEMARGVTSLQVDPIPGDMVTSSNMAKITIKFLVAPSSNKTRTIFVRVALQS